MKTNTIHWDSEKEGEQPGLVVSVGKTCSGETDITISFPISNELRRYVQITSEDDIGKLRWAVDRIEVFRSEPD